jgi:Cu/Ag efflux protein CusF
MNRKIFLSLATLGLALSPVATLAEDAPKPLTVHSSTEKGMVSGGRVEQVTATVTAIDAPNRLVTLKGKKETDTIKMGPEVKNFDQIKVGDRVVVTFSQGLVLALQKPDAKAKDPSVTVSGEAAPLGQKPAGDVKATIKATTTVTKIDLKTRIVTLTGPDGRKFKVKAGSEIPLEKLKIGDKVAAEYTETVGIAVEPAPAPKAKKSATK